jgi:hypothetical protein
VQGRQNCGFSRKDENRRRFKREVELGIVVVANL